MLFPRLLGGALLLRVANVLSSTVMTTTTIKPSHTGKMPYLTQLEAAALDEELFNVYKFSVDQLMELAGLSVATAVARAYPSQEYAKTLIICGPGNNGGDGLVAARHLQLFGYTVSIYYPKRTPKPLYENLLGQCKSFGVKVLEDLPTNLTQVKQDYNLLIDSLFGFSFKPPVREELKPAMDVMIKSGVPVVSVDIPSGWNVNEGPLSNNSLQPDMLISLSAPKLCASPQYLNNAKHFLGGRFLPPDIITKYNLSSLPPYPDQDPIVKLT